MKTYEHDENGKLTTEFSYDKDLKLYQIVIYEFESDKIIKKS
jgi:flagellar hook protein FlgE